ncbi:galactose mutarotase [Labilibacter sediminis]|nr:galactose mutarotase [Labilibacter sediminis]
MKVLNKVLLTLGSILIIAACQQKNNSYDILDANAFKADLNGKTIELYTLTNATGATAQLSNYGARLVSLWMPDRDGNYADVNLGLATGQEYIDSKVRYFGNVVGRYANRIANAEFVLEGDTFRLPKNNGNNILHGGSNGFYNQIWDAKMIGNNKIEFSYLSVDGEEGFPGNVKVSVLYELSDDNELKISYKAITDKTTHINLCNHAFFNLAGEGSGLVYEHELFVNANKYTPLNEQQIPTGELADVKGTPFDFTVPSKIGTRIEDEFDQLKAGNGYDVNYVLNVGAKELKHAATLSDLKSGRVMEVYTTEPGLQLYTANWLDGTIVGKSGKPLGFREAVCIETQHFPDSPNQPHFPSTILHPGEEFESITIYKFSLL